jgi:adenylate cyclase class IV
MRSKLNLELKYFCRDFGPVRRVLKGFGARKMSVRKQTDHYFNISRNNRAHARARLKLRVENGKHILVYYTRPEFSASAKSTPSDVSLLPVADHRLYSFLARSLGISAIVEKRRELWRKGNTVFHCDTIKHVGTIFEIEVWASARTLKRDRAAFAEYRKKLLPYLSKPVRGSNEDLVIAAGK